MFFGPIAQAPFRRRYRACQMLGNLASGLVEIVLGWVLKDWNIGRLRYYTHPPEEISSTVGADTAVSAEIVSQFSKEFDIDALDDDIRKLVEGLPTDTDTTFCSNNSSNEDDNEDDEEMHVDQSSSTVVLSLPSSLEIDGNVQLNSIIRKAIKKKKRAAKKQGKRAEKLAEAMDITSI
ncbi:Guanine nucleotide-binding protein-like 3 [Parelaphostrongylus tenuis]|uniref:Guanine nucleotide-binding protein-like 3 n=1 Tax=Parelaphostrongylus tenuis TaxID=148309 RepID=A0AAD5QLA1_PARTN|nr:Guanine nucleotide-binding protein-like 3 [Parelaphostrongylus tenuis]